MKNSYPNHRIVFKPSLPKLFIVLALLLIGAFNLYAQDVITFKGRITESLTHDPLIYATISIPYAGIGVISNQYGEFTFHIPYSVSEHEIQISFIGFKKQLFNVKDIKEDSIYEIIMVEETNEIEEIQVSNNNHLTAAEFVAKAILQIEKNYPKKTFQLNGYYRDYVMDLTEQYYHNMTEAAVKIEDRGYQYSDLYYTKIAVEQFRLNSLFGLDTTIGKQYGTANKYIPLTDYEYANELVILRGQNPIRNNCNNNPSFIGIINADFFRLHEIKYKGYYEYNGSTIYEITFEAKRVIMSGSNSVFAISGTFFIDANSMAFIKINYLANVVMPGYTGKFVEINLEYQSYQDKYYLNYLSVCNYFERMNELDKTVLGQYYQYRELFVNKIITQSFTKIKNRDAIKKQKSLFDSQNTNPSPDFWDTYNYPHQQKLLY